MKNQTIKTFILLTFFLSLNYFYGLVYAGESNSNNEKNLIEERLAAHINFTGDAIRHQINDLISQQAKADIYSHDDFIEYMNSFTPKASDALSNFQRAVEKRVFNKLNYFISQFKNIKNSNSYTQDEKELLLKRIVKQTKDLIEPNIYEDYSQEIESLISNIGLKNVKLKLNAHNYHDYRDHSDDRSTLFINNKSTQKDINACREVNSLASLQLLFSELFKDYIYDDLVDGCKTVTCLSMKTIALTHLLSFIDKTLLNDFDIVFDDKNHIKFEIREYYRSTRSVDNLFSSYDGNFTIFCVSLTEFPESKSRFTITLPLLQIIELNKLEQTTELAFDMNEYKSNEWKQQATSKLLDGLKNSLVSKKNKWNDCNQQEYEMILNQLIKIIKINRQGRSITQAELDSVVNAVNESFTGFFNSSERRSRLYCLDRAIKTANSFRKTE